MLYEVITVFSEVGRFLTDPCVILIKMDFRSFNTRGFTRVKKLTGKGIKNLIGNEKRFFYM